MLASLNRRPLVAALLIGLAAELLFLFRLSMPGKIVFDEIHYVRAARILMEFSGRTNIEHPLLGKTLIAASMALFGDNPFGWRAFSTLAGTATVVGIFWIMWLAYRRVSLAAFAAFLAIVNQFVFIHARIAMLDGFMAAFLVLAIGAFLWALEREPARRWPRLMLSAVLFGLATGVKWAVIPYIAAACVILLFRRNGEPLFARPFRPLKQVIAFGLLSIFVYLCTFWPDFMLKYDPLPVAQIIPFQWTMYQQQTQVLPAHPYQSSWWSWPLMIRPIWYFYEVWDGAQRGILLVGNPAVMWGGLVAVAACLWAGLRAGDHKMAAIGWLWVFSIAIWAIIPKSLGFYYYYHLSSLWLCLAIPPAIDRYLTPRWKWSAPAFAALALLYFAYFYPILSAEPLAGQQSFTHWTWFDSWR